MKYALIGLSAIALALAGTASAATIIEVTPSSPAPVSNGTSAEGQSLLTPSVTPASDHEWDDIKFNWYTTGLVPLASGSLYILTKQYNGTVAGLSSSTPGFLAESTGIVADGTGDAYTFAPTLKLLPNTEYWFYTSSALTNPLVDPSVGGGSGDLQRYRGTGNPLSFAGPNNTTTLFDLTGTAVPEPATWAMMMLGLFGLGAAMRSTRRRQAAAATA